MTRQVRPRIGRWMLPAFVLIWGAAGGGLIAADSATAPVRPVDQWDLQRRADPLIRRGLEYLAARQAADGGWKGPFPGSDPAITGLIGTAFTSHPAYGPAHPVVQQARACLLRFRQPDGGIYNPAVGYANYATSIAIMFLVRQHDPALGPVIEEARAFVIRDQWDEDRQDNEGRTIDEAHPWHGGAGYGRSRRPDLSNTQWMIEALRESGLPADHPAYCKALIFISRCQMLERTNDQPFARGATDGGFIYSPANGGESMAGTIDVGGQNRLRSYGSMTYAGFKSMIYADVDRRDPRVQAAWDWIRRHYTLEANPNMPEKKSAEGLYYFYQTFAKALAAWGDPLIVLADGTARDWRGDLVETLARRQHADGSWVNTADRWYEGDPELVTAYALLALQAATGGPPWLTTTRPSS